MDCAFDVVSKKSSPYPRSSRFSLMLSSRSFIVLCFIFVCMIHLELTFVKGVRSVSRIHFFACVCPVVPAHFLLHYIAFIPLSKIIWLYLCGYLSGLSILFQWSTGILVDLLRLALLCFPDTEFFKNWRFVAPLCWENLFAPFSQQHLLISCLYVSFWLFSQYVKLFYYYYICYGDLWLVILDVTAMTHWRLRWWLVFFSNKVFLN